MKRLREYLGKRIYVLLIIFWFVMALLCREIALQNRYKKAMQQEWREAQEAFGKYTNKKGEIQNGK